jgi:hypothetical protein
MDNEQTVIIRILPRYRPVTSVTERYIEIFLYVIYDDKEAVQIEDSSQKTCRMKVVFNIAHCKYKTYPFFELGSYILKRNFIIPKLKCESQVTLTEI